MQDSDFTPLFFRLQQEGFLTKSCLATGITEIRNADIGDKGRYYTGFFQLCIGIERTAKLALILDHLARNDLRPPGNRAIRSYGHDLRMLYDATKNIANQRNYQNNISFELDPIRDQILSFLSHFANQTRYSNIDSLAKGTEETNPLSEWNEILESVLHSDVRESKRLKIIQESKGVASMLKNSVFVRMHDLENQPLTVET